MAILAMDQGTTASKAAVFDDAGRLLGEGRAALRTRFGPGGGAEQDPEQIYASQMLAVRRALASAGHPRIRAAGIASQRSTFVVWDRATGLPVGPAPTWQSTAGAGVCRRLHAAGEEVWRRTGLPLSPHYSASKLNLLLARNRRVRRRAERGDLLFGSAATWILWRLTRGAVHAIDPTLAARSLLLDIRTLDWDPWLLDLFDVPRAMLPEIRPSSSEFGTMRVGGAEVPLAACLGDQQAALMGACGPERGRGRGVVLVNYGTGAFVLMPTGSRPRWRPGLLTSIAWTDRSRCRYLLEGTVNAAGALVDWMRRELGAPEDLASIDRLCRAARRDLSMIPAFWGMGPAFEAAHGAGRPSSIVESDRGSGPWTLADITRAGVESVAHLVAEILTSAGASRARATRLIASGGLARLRYLVEYQAALFGAAVSIQPGEEATLRGVALAASGGRRLAPAGRRAVVRPSPRLRAEALVRRRRWSRLVRGAGALAGGEDPR
jgi:glycerol kinase